MVTGTLGVIFCLLRPFNPDNVWLTSQVLGNPLLKIMGLKYIIRGKEKFESLPGVVISNHQNNIDLIAGSKTVPHNTVTLGKTSILYIPLFGLFYWLSGNILINRTNKRKAKASMEKVTEAIRNKGTSVWVMPEGTRSRGRGLMPFKNGAFRTAIDAQVPIVPVCFNSYHSTANFNQWKSGTIVCQVLDPIETIGLEKGDAPRLAQECYEKMSKTLEELDEEFPAS